MFDEDLFIRDHVVAVTRILLGNRRLKDGVVITGGNVLGFEQKLALGQTAADSGADLVHVEFDYDEHSVYRLRSLILMMARDGIVHVKTDCQLWLGTGNRALVLPPLGDRGGFRVATSEIVQVLRRPSDDMAGQARAKDWLARIVASPAGGGGGLSVLNGVAA